MASQSLFGRMNPVPHSGNWVGERLAGGLAVGYVSAGSCVGGTRRLRERLPLCPACRFARSCHHHAARHTEGAPLRLRSFLATSRQRHIRLFFLGWVTIGWGVGCGGYVSAGSVVGGARRLRERLPLCPACRFARSCHHHASRPHLVRVGMRHRHRLADFRSPAVTTLRVLINFVDHSLFHQEIFFA